ncbi:MAG: methionyl-tRNA formyltransferase [Succinivibrio sp.]|nr:methionyl-tRNA formyltransferase [Succinivibrio sp.]
MPRLIFAGTPPFAAAHLQGLLDLGLRPVAVYTQPDRPAGRGKHLTPSAVKTLAAAQELEVRTPLDFKDPKEVAALAELQADLMVVVAYGLILPEAVLQAPRLGAINVHASLLPLYRGAAPIQRALLEGQPHTGVSIMQLESRLDAGPVFARRSLPISSEDTSQSLFDKLQNLGVQLLKETLEPILSGELKARAQDESAATYAAKFDKTLAPLDFTHDSRSLDLQIRATIPWPVATATLEGITYKIFKARPLGEDELVQREHSYAAAAPGTILGVQDEGLWVRCGQGALALEILQAPGKKPLNAAVAARTQAQRFAQGKRFD